MADLATWGGIVSPRQMRIAAQVLLCAGMMIATVPARGADDVATLDRLFARVVLARKEIESIRLEMGRPEPEPSGIIVTDAVTREIFSVAQNMFEKANRLSFERTRELAPEPKKPVGEILPFDVSVVISAVLTCLREVKATLGISDPVEEPIVAVHKTPSEVFLAIFEANRQLDLLLDQRVGPSEVFQRVTLAIGYTARLLARFPGQSRIPEPPPLERRRFPADVYRRLLGCFELVRSAAMKSNIDILQIETGDRGYGWVSSADSFELASLLVAELSSLHSRIPAAQPPRSVYYPGRKLPSHVHQRAGILEIQLRNLSRSVAREPDWLTRPEID